jgi:DeoR/GlpR family transcriptional regulator of sugar metabolism
MEDIIMKDDASTTKRRTEILGIIKEQKRTKVAHLKEVLDVSSVTIGKDLLHLESKGLINRRFGYAEIRTADVFKKRDNIVNFEQKRRIAAHTLEYIEDGISVFFYMSSTVLILARMLENRRNLNVVTNSFEIAHDITSNLKVKTIILGGYYSPDYVATFGEESVNQFELYNIDKIFFTCNGVSAQDGLTIDEPFEKELNKAMITSSSKKYLLADGSKVGRTGFVKFAPVNSIDVLITDSKADKEECEKIRALGVEVIIA